MTGGVENVHAHRYGDEFVAYLNWEPIPGVEGARYDAAGFGSTLEAAIADAVQDYADAELGEASS
jgi:hypothetical protein